jgi:AraC-like DNA-binding protein
MAVDTGLLIAEQRQVFEQRLSVQMPIPLNQKGQDHYKQVVSALYEHFRSDREQPFYRQILYALLQAFTGMVAVQYKLAECPNQKVSRKTELTLAFKTLLTENLKTVKSPSAYADKLNVSATYLNEALKQTTGLPVSYWITQEVLLEAKRLLYYSKLNVKQIAHELGYEDHAYFSRLFKAQSGVTPIEFRAAYSE